MSKTAIKFSPKQLEAIYRPYNYTFDVLEGTPRSGKTTAGHFRYADYLSWTRDTNHLIVAYNQEQAQRLFIDGDGTGLQHIFGDLAEIKHNELGSNLEIHTPNGIKRVFYKGGGKSNSVGAITGMSLGSVVFCEINLLNMGMIQECFRRTFAAQDRYHLADLNPPAPNHPVISEVFDVQNTRWTHWTPNDNPILSEQRKQEIFDVLSKNPYLLERDWYGKRVMPQGVIYGMFNMDKNVEHAVLGDRYEMFFTADGGQSDATSCSCNIVTRFKDKFRLMRVAHYYHSGAETGQVKAMSIYAKELKVFIEWCVRRFQMRYTEVFVDPACKSLREELHLLGINTTGADNNAHDVSSSAKGMEVGIERLQNLMTNEQFYIVECDEYDHYHFLKEIGMYVRQDNGSPIDAYNHSLDEARYSGNYFYNNYVK
ncbi:PBSX family phage terminase large subunit [Bacillus sp. S70]|uniref:PBSX family phage terminase large subunit n=3 Tax=Bacillus TaxID=1386 RepID=UPI001909376B|nr:MULTISPECIES: PBSX family phage terminase large subunit [unclassified Bacillus (in: firmicutes)]MBJ9983573.1 PBSX family phage terminase large subunit [Bacillus sp. S29]MBK0104766.1 PBSX family phage terminase large subunit [Bacillus sp. S70]MBK0110027.1 PBSX family phage terminase large subunit [Bacillus sp. S73]MBK0147998.1 PBSX family phage terminase large subunit [Bacillus sp. S74]MBK0161499.1 PBSX family phage terminase large subunit [Bacillus sp. S71]